MDKLDFEEVSKHINILNVAYHLSLEITEKRGLEIKAICPLSVIIKTVKLPL